MSTLSDRWIWFTVLSVILVLTVPLVVVWLILQPYMSPEARILATVLIVVVWGIVAGYKDWIIAKRKEAGKELTET